MQVEKSACRDICPLPHSPLSYRGLAAISLHVRTAMANSSGRRFEIGVSHTSEIFQPWLISTTHPTDSIMHNTSKCHSGGGGGKSINRIWSDPTMEMARFTFQWLKFSITTYFNLTPRMYPHFSAKRIRPYPSSALFMSHSVTEFLLYLLHQILTFLLEW